MPNLAAENRFVEIYLSNFLEPTLSPVTRPVHPPSHAAHSSPGRTPKSITEAPNRSVAVALPASDQPSRPGPAFGSREGVFQAHRPGEYSFISDRLYLDADPPSSNLSSSVEPPHTSPAALYTPGRLLYSSMEAPNRSGAVALPASDLLSRPGPAFGSREGVFQAHLPGEYSFISDRLYPDADPPSSNLSSSDEPPHTSPAALYTLGRLLYSTMEAPNRSGAVAFPASGQPSRPGPAFGSRAGVFQNPATGEYPLALAPTSFHPDPFVACRPRPKPSPRPQRVTAVDTITRLEIYYENAGGMNTYVGDYHLACSGNPYGIIIVNETWLDARTLSHQVFGSGYEVFRGDRTTLTSKKQTGGGVAIAVRRGIAKSVTHLTDIKWNCLEQVWIALDFGERKIFICTLYLPPDRTRDKALYEAHVDSVNTVLSKLRLQDEVVIIGDLNFDKLRWLHSHDGFLYPDPRYIPESSNITELLDFYSIATLEQINCFANDCNNTLDLCFVSKQDVAPVISIAPAPLVKNVPHHVPLLLSLEVIRNPVQQPISDPVRYDSH